MVRLADFIQKTIHVTMATATKDMIPAKSFSAVSDSTELVRLRISATPTLMATATATPAQTHGRADRRSVRTR